MRLAGRDDLAVAAGAGSASPRVLGPRAVAGRWHLRTRFCHASRRGRWQRWPQGRGGGGELTAPSTARERAGGGDPSRDGTGPEQVATGEFHPHSTIAVTGVTRWSRQLGHTGFTRRPTPAGGPLRPRSLASGSWPRSSSCRHRGPTGCGCSSSPSPSSPRSTGSPTPYAGSSSTSRPRATRRSWWRRPGPATYAGFPVTRARGASLPFYKDFRIGLETRRRLRAVMVRFRPDVVHIASPATLGYQAAKAAARARHPDGGDLPDRPGRVRRALRHPRRRARDGRADPQDPHPGRPHAGPVVGQPAPARGAGDPGHRAVAARGRPAGLPPRPPQPVAAAASSPPTAGSSSATSAGSPPRRSWSC